MSSSGRPMSFSTRPVVSSMPCGPHTTARRRPGPHPPGPPPPAPAAPPTLPPSPSWVNSHASFSASTRPVRPVHVLPAGSAPVRVCLRQHNGNNETPPQTNSYAATRRCASRDHNDTHRPLTTPWDQLLGCGVRGASAQRGCGGWQGLPPSAPGLGWGHLGGRCLGAPSLLHPSHWIDDFPPNGGWMGMFWLLKRLGDQNRSMDPRWLIVPISTSRS